MTYREAIQRKIEQVEILYTDAGYLRDHATEPEKDTWNEVRSLTGELLTVLNRLDNRISESRAAKIVGDGY